MIEEAGLKLDEDFLLAFSPERVDPGNPRNDGFDDRVGRMNFKIHKIGRRLIED
jgi:UDP-N-acetyl-D-mannosaminuronate dehydrogenase